MKSLKPVLVFAAFALLLILSPRQDAGAEEAKSLEELAARYDVGTCKKCHRRIYKEWQKSAHATSAFGRGGRTAGTIRNTIQKGLMTWPHSGVKGPEDVKADHLMLCAKCHFPQLNDATDGVVQEFVAALMTLGKQESRDKLKKLNVNCLVCHYRKAITHKWLDGYPQPNTLYATRKMKLHVPDYYPTMQKTPIMSEAVLCGQCHGLGPNLEFDQPSQCATAYGSYLFAYIPEGGKETCQDCHMRKLNKGHAMPSYGDPDMAKAAMEFTVDAYYEQKTVHDRATPMAVAKIEMTNRTGHGIPDG